MFLFQSEIYLMLYDCKKTTMRPVQQHRKEQRPLAKLLWSSIMIISFKPCFGDWEKDRKRVLRCGFSCGWLVWQNYQFNYLTQFVYKHGGSSDLFPPGSRIWGWIHPSTGGWGIPTLRLWALGHPISRRGGRGRWGRG